MNETAYFINLELQNIRAFKEKTILDLSDGSGGWKRWTVILGDNGTGKSTILECLSLLEVKAENTDQISGNRRYYLNSDKINYKRYAVSSFNDSYLQIDKTREVSTIKAEILYDKATIQKRTTSVSYDLGLEIKPDSTMFEGVFYFDTRVDLIIYAYGANRKIGLIALKDKFNQNNNETLFNEDAKLINAEEWLLQLDYAASKDSEIKEFVVNKRNQVIQILLDLLPGVEQIRISSPTKINLIPAVEFRTSFGWITLDQLSLGYKTMVAWMIDLAAKMFERYPESLNPLAEPAIVLVDEIDLHLHPKWQRKIFSYLSDKFPKTQFIITAHSPLVVQAAPDDANIVLLRKEGDRVIIDNDINSVKSWRIDQILTSDLFGLENVRSSETATLLDERTKLLQKERLSGDEKIRLNHLNNIAHTLPTADNENDIEAMEIIRKAAEYLRNQNPKLGNDKN